VSTARQLEPEDSPNQLTIEQLAAQSGMSVRNIRAHQARGLLEGPEVRLRVGYYGPQHLAQLRLIRELPRSCGRSNATPTPSLSSFVQIFLAEVWKPFAQAQMPPERRPETEQAVERLRPIASAALMAIFQQRLATQIDAALVEITRRQADRPR
jgi:DNA-binding transcriptional MerR regulator